MLEIEMQNGGRNRRGCGGWDRRDGLGGMKWGGRDLKRRRRGEDFGGLGEEIEIEGGC